jgi:hypothetical protein
MGSLVHAASRFCFRYDHDEHVRVVEDCPLAPEPVLKAFEKSAAPIFHRALRNICECGALRALRDTLLPKLISGELRVGDGDDHAVAARLDNK